MNVVVVGVDNGPHCEAAFKRALKTFDREYAVYHIVFVRAPHPEAMVEDVPSPGMRRQLEEMRKKEGKQVLNKFRVLAERANVKFNVVELEGDPREVLCHYCETACAEVLVLGSRGAGFLERLLLGSVSSYCTHHAPCAVFVDRCSHDAAARVSAPAVGS